MNFTQKHCGPCESGVLPIGGEEAQKYLTEVLSWDLIDDSKKIERGFKFKDFKEAMAFVNKVAELAEAEGHHPDITISWSRVTLILWTHAIGGLSENDFIMAAKINAIVTRNP